MAPFDRDDDQSGGQHIDLRFVGWRITVLLFRPNEAPPSRTGELAEFCSAPLSSKDPFLIRALVGVYLDCGADPPFVAHRRRRSHIANSEARRMHAYKNPRENHLLSIPDHIDHFSSLRHGGRLVSRDRDCR